MSAETPPFLFLGSLGHYRQPFLEALLGHYRGEVKISAGHRGEDARLHLVSVEQVPHTVVRNFYLFHGVLIQWPFFEAASTDRLLVCDFNPRNLTVYVLLVYRRLCCKRTLLWGHAWSRHARGMTTRVLRKAMMALSDGIIVYSESQRADLKSQYPKVAIGAAPNSLLTRNHFGFLSNSERNELIYVGRLIDGKKVSLLLRAAVIACKDIPDLRIRIVGDGGQMPSLMEEARDLGLEDRLSWSGHQEDVLVLKSLYAKSFAAVSPGYVGLSAIQAISQGVPIIYGDREPHAPEVEALNVNNSYPFEANSEQSLAIAIRRAWDNRPELEVKGPAISNDAALAYSVEAMCEGFVQFVNERTR